MIKFDYIFGAGQPKPKCNNPLGFFWFNPTPPPVRPFNIPPIRGVVLNEKLSNISTSNSSTSDSWMTERFKNKFSEDLAEAVKLLNKNLNTNLKKEDKKMDIKAELHKLIDGLDEELYKKNVTMWTIGTGHSVSALVTSLLTESQKPIKKTLGQELEDRGFTLLSRQDPVIYGGKKITITITVDCVIVRPITSLNTLSPNCLTSALDDHEQTFADIAYLQQR